MIPDACAAGIKHMDKRSRARMGLLMPAAKETERLEESGLPQPIIEAVQHLFEATRWIFPEGSLSLGGGTVLQARWSHRESTDADLFCDPGVYHFLFTELGHAFEETLYNLTSEPARLFVERTGLYVEIGSVETTVVPAFRAVGQRTHRHVPGTSVETWSSADILAGKLIHRIYGKGVAEPRDLYDLATAAHRDGNALRQAVRTLSRRERRLVCGQLDLLPASWADASTKPLLGLPEAPYAYTPDIIARLIHDAAKRRPAPSKEMTHDHGNA